MTGNLCNSHTGSNDLPQNEQKYYQFDCGCAFKILGYDKEGVPYLDIHKDLSNISLDCPAVWKMLGLGLTKGVFQLETNLGKTSCQKLRPESIDHMAALSALLRPGCLEAKDEFGVNMPEHFFRRKNGEEEVSYYHPALKEVLSDTYGILIYQEASIYLSRYLAGFSLQEADMLRKGLGKKDTAIVAKCRESFLEGCKKVNIVNEKEATDIFNWIEKGQRYLFNKCLSGDCIIGRHGYRNTHTIAQLYKIYNSLDYARKNKYMPIRHKFHEQGNYGETLSVDQYAHANPNTVLKIYKSGEAPVFEMVVNGNFKIKATANHKFPTPYGEVPLCNLKQGDKVYAYEAVDNHKRVVVGTIWSITYVGIERVFDVEVAAPNHNLLVNGVFTCNSHSVGYGLNGYYSAWLKAHRPAEFFANFLKYSGDKMHGQDDAEELIEEARAFGIKTTVPDIRFSSKHFAKNNSEHILFGISDIKGVGEAQYKKLTEAKDKVSENITWTAFLTRIWPHITSTAAENLIKAGALDMFGMSRSLMLYEMSIWDKLSKGELKHASTCDLPTVAEIIQWLLDNQKYANYKQKDKLHSLLTLLTNTTSTTEDNPAIIEQWEKELLGISLSYGTNLSCTGNMFCADFNHGRQERDIRIAAEIKSLREYEVKSGDNAGSIMAYLSIKDDTASVEGLMWSSAYDKYKETLALCEKAIFEGYRDKKKGTFIIQKVRPIY